jgi:hypothetical protein
MIISSDHFSENISSSPTLKLFLAGNNSSIIQAYNLQFVIHQSIKAPEKKNIILLIFFGAKTLHFMSRSSHTATILFFNKLIDFDILLLLLLEMNRKKSYRLAAI